MEEQKSESLKPTDSKTLPKAAMAAVMKGDWGGVQDSDRIIFLKHLCESLRIPLPLCPFQFIPMKGGKIALYAPSEAFSLIAKKNAISTEIMANIGDEKTGLNTQTNTYTVIVKASDATGRFTVDYAKIYVGSKNGQDKADAEMKTITKAKRRAIKSLVGVSVYDEDDIEWMRRNNAQPERLNAEDVSQDIPDHVDVVPSPVDQETQDLRNLLFSTLVGEGGKFTTAKQAGDWIYAKTSKYFDQLNATEVNDLLALLESEATDVDDSMAVNQEQSELKW